MKISILSFFLHHKKANHLILFFIVLFGIYSYIKIPKEVLPNLELEKIVVRGSYTGASSEIINKVVVKDLENELKSVVGVKKIRSYIRVGFYYIVLDISKSEDKNRILEQVKDSIETIRSNIPSDIDLPIAYVAIKKSRVVTFTIESNILTQNQMRDIRDDIESDILSIGNINSITTRGLDTNSMLIQINSQKAKALGISNKELSEYISESSFIFPVGNIEKSGYSVYIATKSKDTVKSWLNEKITINGKTFYLKDIANVSKGVVNDRVLSRVNGKKNIFISVTKGDNGNIIKLAEKIKEILKKEQKLKDNFSYTIRFDGSKVIQSRLNLIISSIIISILLVGALLTLFISKRSAILVLFGVPTSFLIGISILYITGYSLTIMTLLAMFITVGILIDDAIIVTEKIENNLEKGMDVYSAINSATSSLFKPILIAMLTTVVAFLPLVYTKDRIGILISPIPIVVSIFLFASYIESFFFLPVHATDFLRSNNKISIGFSPILNLYKKLLRFLYKNKIKFIFILSLVCIISIPILYRSLNYHFMPKPDSNTLYFSIKLPSKYILSDTDRISKIYEDILFKNSKKLQYESVRTVVGYLKSTSSGDPIDKSSFTIVLGLKPYTIDNFFYRYVVPIINFDFNFSDKRYIDSNHVNKLVHTLFKDLNKEYGVSKLNSIVGDGISLFDHDVEIEFSSKNLNLLKKEVIDLSKIVKKLKHVENSGTNIEAGTEEIKFSINSYGQSLGLNDGYVSKILRTYFLDNRSAQLLDNYGSMNIVIQSSYKNSISSFKNFYIPIPNKNQNVRFMDIADLHKYSGLATIEKINSDIFFSLYVDLDNSKTTARNFLRVIKPYLDNMKNRGISIRYAGEEEKNREFFSSFIIMFIVATFVILLLLYFMLKRYFDVFAIISVAFLSSFSVLLAHYLLGVSLYVTSFIGFLGLFGVVVNDGILMVEAIRDSSSVDDIITNASSRCRAIFLTTVTTFLGMLTLIYFPTGEGVIVQPLAISLGFGLLFGTLLNLFYLPIFYIFKKKF